MLQKTQQSASRPTAQQEIEIKIKPTLEGLKQIEQWNLENIGTMHNLSADPNLLRFVKKIKTKSI